MSQEARNYFLQMRNDPKMSSVPDDAIHSYVKKKFGVQPLQAPTDMPSEIPLPKEYSSDKGFFRQVAEGVVEGVGSATQSLGNSLVLGQGDAIHGAIHGGLEYAGNQVANLALDENTQDNRSFNELYHKNKGEFNSLQKTGRKNAPILTAMGDIAGGIVGGNVLAKGAEKLGKKGLANVLRGTAAVDASIGKKALMGAGAGVSYDAATQSLNKVVDNANFDINSSIASGLGGGVIGGGSAIVGNLLSGSKVGNAIATSKIGNAILGKSKSSMGNGAKYFDEIGNPTEEGKALLKPTIQIGDGQQATHDLSYDPIAQKILHNKGAGVNGGNNSAVQQYAQQIQVNKDVVGIKDSMLKQGQGGVSYFDDAGNLKLSNAEAAGNKSSASPSESAIGNGNTLANRNEAIANANNAQKDLLTQGYADKQRIAKDKLEQLILDNSNKIAELRASKLNSNTSIKDNHKTSLYSKKSALLEQKRLELEVQQAQFDKSINENAQNPIAINPDETAYQMLMGGAGKNGLYSKMSNGDPNFKHEGLVNIFNPERQAVATEWKQLNNQYVEPLTGQSSVSALKSIYESKDPYALTPIFQNIAKKPKVADRLLPKMDNGLDGKILSQPNYQDGWEAFAEGIKPQNPKAEVNQRGQDILDELNKRIKLVESGFNKTEDVLKKQIPTLEQRHQVASNIVKEQGITLDAAQKIAGLEPSKSVIDNLRAALTANNKSIGQTYGNKIQSELSALDKVKQGRLSDVSSKYLDNLEQIKSAQKYKSNLVKSELGNKPNLDLPPARLLNYVNSLTKNQPKTDSQVITDLSSVFNRNIRIPIATGISKVAKPKGFRLNDIYDPKNMMGGQNNYILEALMARNLLNLDGTKQ
jgi:hypothetical protein